MNKSETLFDETKYFKDLCKKLQEENIIATLLDKKETKLPLDLVSMPIKADNKHRERFLMLSFYPFEEAILERNRYLQLFIQLPVVLDEQALPKFLMILPEVNNIIPIGNFGYQFDEKKAYFRYVLMLAENEKNAYRKVKELYEMLPFILDTLDETLKQLDG